MLEIIVFQLTQLTRIVNNDNCNTIPWFFDEWNDIWRVLTIKFGVPVYLNKSYVLIMTASALSIDYFDFYNDLVLVISFSVDK